MVGACSMHWRSEKYIQNFSQKTQGRRHHLKDLCINGKIILEWILGK